MGLNLFKMSLLFLNFRVVRLKGVGKGEGRGGGGGALLQLELHLSKFLYSSSTSVYILVFFLSAVTSSFFKKNQYEGHMDLYN